jgi:hypothetical protein
MKTSKALTLAAALVAVVTADGLRAAERELVLRDFLNRQWTQELITFPFTANTSECDPASVTLTGPQGPVPVQLSRIERWPGTKWVKSARLSFIASLAPLAKDTYTVRYGTEPTGAPGPATDLRVTPKDGQVEIATRRFGARFLLGDRTYPEPAAAADVPGPVSALRLADGTWFGGSRLFGPDKLKSYAARLTSSGPVFAEVETIYTYADGNTVKLVAQVAAGDSAVLWDVQVREHRPQAGWDLLLQGCPENGTGTGRPCSGASPVFAGLPPLVFRVQMEFWTRREVFLKGKARVGDTAELPLDKQPAGLITNLTPWPDWFNDYTQTTIPLKLSGRDTELHISSRDAGAWVEPVPPDDPRHSPSLGDKLLPLWRGEGGEVFLRVNAAAGDRRWTLGESTPEVRRLRPADDGVNRIGPQPHGAAELQPSSAVGRRLDAVKDYVLDWPQNPRHRHPFLYLSREQLVATQHRDRTASGVVSGPGANQTEKSLPGKDSRPLRPLPDMRALLDSLRQHKTVPPVPDGSSNPAALGAYLLTGDWQIAAELKVADRLRRHLDLLGHFDKMRNTQSVVSLYDALIDSDLVTAEERPLLRAQMAYLGYNLADPYTWSAPRGYCSGNPNMTVAFVLNLGSLACALPDHPLASTWAQPALQMMERWLAELGPEGEHPESVANYANVSLYNMLGFAIAAHNAGLHDYVHDPRMKKLMLYLAKQYTPLDPRYGYSKLPPAGRGPVGVRTVLAGLMARATQDRDPEYSRVQQWVWQQEGYPYAMEGRLGGYEYVYADPSLPVSTPVWTTDLFPKYGVIFRHGWGTKDADYINFQVHMRDGYPSTNGSFPVIFAKGTPISTVFVESYRDREELLVSRVLPARRRGTLEERRACYFHDEEQAIADFASLARQDYAAVDITIKSPRPAFHLGGDGRAAALEELSIVQMPEWPPVPRAGSPPIAWRRQILFLKDAAAAGASYLLLRDTVSGGQPTIWQFWTLSERLGTAEEARNRGAFLTGKPGHQAVEPRVLRGDRFTAVGQFGVDVEYYVAGPTDTPRYALRAGEEYGGQKVFQDLLHLQRPGDGAYFVALFPRKPDEHVPEFATLGEGLIVKVSGDFGTDYGFLSGTEREARGEGVSFRGTAASVQDRKSGVVLSLGAKGAVRYRDFGLTADHAASLRVGGDELLVEAPAGRRGGPLLLTAPGAWKLAQPPAGLSLAPQADARWALTIPAELPCVKLVK